MKIRHVDLWEAITIPGTNIAGDKSIQPRVSTKHPGCLLTLTPEGLIVEYRGCIALVPMGNVKLVLFDKEEAGGGSSKPDSKD